MLRVAGILEIALYVTDLPRTAEYYRRLFGFATLLETERLIAFDVAPGNVLLLFPVGATSESLAVPGGVIPGHRGSAGGHFAFAIAANEVSAWKARLADEGIPLEGEVAWLGGAHSLYFRDPDQQLVELMSPGFWANYQSPQHASP